MAKGLTNCSQTAEAETETGARDASRGVQLLEGPGRASPWPPLKGKHRPLQHGREPPQSSRAVRPVEPPPGLCLPEGYVRRSEPLYFTDVDLAVTWQPDVYPEAAAIARCLGATRLIDIGCGNGRKLKDLANDFDLIGLDIGVNIEACRRAHGHGLWLEHDLESLEPLPLTREQLTGAVLICSDVIEHLRHPERLLREIRRALNTAQAVLFSTPEREIHWGSAHRGPPPNRCHVQEWSRCEFQTLLRCSGFTHCVAGLTRANDGDHLLRAILAVCFQSAFAMRRAGVEYRA